MRSKNLNTTPIDTLNRHTWDRVADEFSAYDSWADPGERSAILSIASAVRSHRILDVGVGAGRSTWLLKLLSDEYIGLDYTASMVERCRTAHPTSDIRRADARYLLDLPAGTFDLIAFTNNGIDAMSHEDRMRTLAGFARLLSPTGFLLFSTFNKDGPAWKEPPWRLAGQQPPSHGPLWRSLRGLSLLPKRQAMLRRRYVNWWKHRALSQDHDSWGLASIGAHDFGILAHFTTLNGVAQDLNLVGLNITNVWSHDGAVLDAHGSSAAIYFTIIATRQPQVPVEGPDPTHDLTSEGHV